MSKKTLLLLSCFILIAFAAETALPQTDNASVRCPDMRINSKAVQVELETAETDAIWLPSDYRVTNNTRNDYFYYSNRDHIAVDSQFRLHVIWHQYNASSRYDIHYCRYYPGTGWTSDTVLTATTGYHRYPYFDSRWGIRCI